MKISCSKISFQKGTGIVLKAVAAKSTFSIQECIIIEAYDNTISLMANNNDLAIRTDIDGVIVDEGTIAVEARLFSEIIRKLPDNDVTLSTFDNFQVMIECENVKFHIAGQSGEEFSYLPEIEKNESICLSQMNLRELIKQTIFSISSNDLNKIMTGVLFEIKGGLLKVVSLDGHRISRRNHLINENDVSTELIISGKTLVEVSKILSGEIEDQVNILYTDNHVAFEMDHTLVVSSLIEGDFFNVDSMISRDYETKIEINKKDFLESIERSLLFVREDDKKPIVLDIRDEEIEIRINSKIGSMNDRIEIDKEGHDLIIGFNPAFFVDALRVIDEERIKIYFMNSKSPCFITDDNDKYIYFILPVTIGVN